MPNTTCRRSSCMASQQIRRVTGSGANSCRNDSRSTKLPSPSTDSRNDASAKSDSATRVNSDCRPPARRRAHLGAPQQRPPAEDLHVPGLVGHLHGEKLHDLPEVRVDAPHEPGRHDEGGLLVLDQVRHHLHHRGLDVGRQRERVVPRHRGLRVPLSGGSLRVQVGAMSAQTRSRSSRSNRASGPPASSSAPRAPSPHRAGGRLLSADGRAGPARSAPNQRSSSADPRTTTATSSSASPRSGAFDPVAPATTPGGQVHAQRRVAPGDRQPAAGRQPGQGALHQQVRAPAEAQVTQVERRRPASRSRPVVRGRHPPVGGVETAGRRPPSARASYPVVRPSCQAVSPSRSSSGRTCGSAYDMPSSSVPKSRTPSDSGCADRHVAVVVAVRSAPRSGCPRAVACPPGRTPGGWRRSCRRRRPPRPPGRGPRRVRRRCGRRAGRHRRRSGVRRRSTPARRRGGPAGSASPVDCRPPRRRPPSGEVRDLRAPASRRGPPRPR